MQKFSSHYIFYKTIIYDLSAESAAILIEEKQTGQVSIDKCCFYKYSSDKGPAAIYLDVSMVSIQRSLFVKMVSKDVNSIGASTKLFSKNTNLSFSSVRECEISSYGNIYIEGNRIQISYINNTHNPIKHITFAYLYRCVGDVSYCNVHHNPSIEGVEFQSSFCNSCIIHHCSFTYNKCSDPSTFHNYGVIRLYNRGVMNAEELYFFKNDKVPLSKDDLEQGQEVIFNARMIYTDRESFYSVTPSDVFPISSLPVHFGGSAAVGCMGATVEHRMQPRLLLLLTLTPGVSQSPASVLFDRGRRGR